jgi:hypothetical protein
MVIYFVKLIAPHPGVELNQVLHVLLVKHSEERGHIHVWHVPHRWVQTHDTLRASQCRALFHVQVRNQNFVSAHEAFTVHHWRWTCHAVRVVTAFTWMTIWVSLEARAGRLSRVCLAICAVECLASSVAIAAIPLLLTAPAAGLAGEASVPPARGTLFTDRHALSLP